MRRNYTSQEKEMVVKRFLCGETVTAISKSTDISRSTIYALTKAYDDCIQNIYGSLKNYNNQSKTILNSIILNDRLCYVIVHPIKPKPIF